MDVGIFGSISLDAQFFPHSIEGGAIMIRGIVHTPAEYRRIEEAARKINGNVPLRCELHYRS